MCFSFLTFIPEILLMVVAFFFLFCFWFGGLQSVDFSVKGSPRRSFLNTRTVGGEINCRQLVTCNEELTCAGLAAGMKLRGKYSDVLVFYLQ